MHFKIWLESRYYHGTQDGDNIRQSGFNVSTSGGGQRGLMGVWLTKDVGDATRYANALKEKEGKPEVLEVEVPDDLKIADLNAVETSARSQGDRNDATKSRWKFLGYDIDDLESLSPLRDMQPFAATKILQQMGYDGAWIPNTIGNSGSPELVIFDPKNVRLL